MSQHICCTCCAKLNKISKIDGFDLQHRMDALRALGSVTNYKQMSVMRSGDISIVEHKLIPNEENLQTTSTRMWILSTIVLSVSVTAAGTTCHCKPSSLCGTFPASPCSANSMPEKCHKGWHGQYCQKENAALDRRTEQSSTYRQWSTGQWKYYYFTSGHAVDGKTTTTFYTKPYTCTHTQQERSPTWTVDLNKTASDKIFHMKLYLRNDQPNRIKGLKILVDNQICYNWTSHERPSYTQEVTCRRPLSGNTVTITIPDRKEFLTLCEVQIFICSDGWFDDECDKQCNCRDNREVCDKIFGHCVSGCAAGFDGEDCQTPCVAGTFGVNCSENCGNCLDNAVCDRTSGTCPSGCQSGWMNDTCSQPCTDGYFGMNCSSVCGRCFSGTVCNKTTGVCPGECEAGWSNQTCLEPCQDGQYGDRCSILCGHCQNSSVCNKTTGHCLHGCQENYASPYCKECLDGHFGQTCNETCGMCDRGEPCNKTYGRCPNGCVSGYVQEDEFCRTVSDESVVQVGLIAGSAGGTVTGILVITIIIVLTISYKRRHQRDSESSSSITNNSQPMKELGSVIQDNVTKPGNNVPLVQVSDEDEDAVFSVENDLYVSSEDMSTYYNWVSPAMSLDKLQHCFKDTKTRLTLETQFKAIPYGLRQAHDVGKKPANKSKNRFVALYPYDHTRVILEGKGKDGYINANYIYGFDDTKKYIATQGPKDLTIRDFWQMIWQARVSTIVMLTQLQEHKKSKCAQYWPNETECKQYGKFRVTSKEVTVRSDYTISKLLVQCTGHGERVIHHFHYTTWPDHGVPSAPALVTFWKKVKQDKRKEPLVIHCSAGVGRTGTFIALDYLVDEFESENKVNVFMCVTRMREARMNMVQTLAQYQFVHEAVLEALQSQGTMYTSSDLNTMLGVDKVYTVQTEDLLKQQFKDLKPELSHSDFSNALLPENVAKNRDQDILPDNKSRLNVSTQVRGRNEYINAIALSSVVRASMLVVTQTPLPDTVVDFWRLVADHDCFTIVCLDASQEAHTMYPQKNGKLQCDPFTIQLTEERATDVYTDRQIVLTNTSKPGEGYCIRVLAITSVVPMWSDTTQLLDLVNRVDRLVCSTDHNVLVHCRDGARFCGIFCAALIVIGRLRLDNEVDIFSTTRELQCARPQFVQTYEQYRLIYDVVREYNLSSSVYANLR